MSGGHFDYAQHRIHDIADEVADLIASNDSEELDSFGEKIGRGYSPEIIAHFKEGENALRRAYVYAQRIDWLVSGDDGPDCFLSRLKEDLEELEPPEKREGQTRIEKCLVRIAEAHGINSPLILIANAIDDEENYAEILARIIEQKMGGKE